MIIADDQRTVVCRDEEAKQTRMMSNLGIWGNSYRQTPQFRGVVCTLIGYTNLAFVLLSILTHLDNLASAGARNANGCISRTTAAFSPSTSPSPTSYKVIPHFDYTTCGNEHLQTITSRTDVCYTRTDLYCMANKERPSWPAVRAGSASY